MLVRLIASIALSKRSLFAVAAATAITALVLLAASDAQAACAPIAGAGLVPPPGTVVTCTGSTINQNPPNGYGTGSQNGLTVNVEVGALVQGSPGLNLNSDNTINNFGTISSLTGAPGLFLQSSDNTINNSGTISSASGEGIRSGAGTTITNSGAISGSGNPAITSGAGTTITNTGTITGGGGVAVAAVTLSGAGNTIINSGTITGLGAGGAISLGGGSGTLTLLPSSVIVGIVTAGATDTLQLGGTGSDSFNVSLIGPAQQYRGFGSFQKVGDSTWTLTGTGGYTVPTTVNAGTLIVNGSIATSSGLSVNAAGTVGGTGTLPSTTINGGTLSPGNSIGTITVQGSLTFVAPGLYVVEISPTAADRTNVTGTATLAGTVQVVSEPGTYTPGTVYTMLNATGSVSGTFAGLTSNFASTFLAPALSYDANNVFLTIARNGVSFASVGWTPNQIATGGAVDTLGLGNPIVDAVALGTAAQARAAFDLLSGEIHASAASIVLDDSRYVRDAVIGRLRQSYGPNSGVLAALGSGGPVVASIGQSIPAPYALGYGRGEQPDYAAPAIPSDNRLAAWGQALGAWGNIDSDGNAATLQRSLGGIITGVDATFDDRWRLGLAGGYTQSSLDIDARLSSGSLDNYHLALYGGGQLGALGVRAGAAYSWNSIDTTRTISFPGFFDRTTATYDAGTTQVFGDVGYAFGLGRAALEPFAALAYVNLQNGDFTETGGAAALTAASQSLDATFTTLGLRAATLVALTDRTEMTAHGTIAWRHAFGDVTPEFAFAFASNGLPFTIAGVPIAEDSLVVDAGLDFNVTADARLGVAYSGQLASDAQDNAILGNLHIAF